MAELQFTDGNIILSGNLIDAILVGLSIDMTVKYDEASNDTFSGSIKRPIGFNDAIITATVELITDEFKSCYERLFYINNIFKTTRDGKIGEYKILNKHINARGIRTVLFDNLTSSETDADDIISVNLRFIEYKQPVEKKEEERVIARQNTSQVKEKDSKIKQVVEIIVNIDPKKYLKIMNRD